MRINLKAAALAVAAAALCGLAACATSYGAMTLTGGYKEVQLEPGIWRVGFFGNGYTTRETVQTYWLYHSADLALSQGYDGFQLVTPVRLTGFETVRPSLSNQGQVIRIGHGGGGGGHGGSRGGYVVYGGRYAVSAHPYLNADIKLIRKPYTTVPGKVFDAAALKAALEPLVKGAKCNGNVCPHVHRYLYPVTPGDKPS
jgi:hypothetical protein